MAKKPVALDGLLNIENRPTDTGIPQRGKGHGAPRDRKLTKRLSEKRPTLALDGETYKRLRLYAVETDQTHQAILEAALAEYLKRVNA